MLLVWQVLKPSEKFKFSFDWDMNEDTSRDLNPLYQDRPESALLFGRGTAVFSVVSGKLLVSELWGCRKAGRD